MELQSAAFVAVLAMMLFFGNKWAEAMSDSLRDKGAVNEGIYRLLYLILLTLLLIACLLAGAVYRGSALVSL